MKVLTLVFLPIIIFAQQNIVEPFLPDVFSKFPNVRDITISADGSEIYFSLQSYADEVSMIVCVKKVNDNWLEPEIANFSGRYYDLEPFLSADGLKLYFASNRPISISSTEAKDFDIWYVRRENKNAAWSDPINIGPPINSDKDEFYPSVADNNNFYFTCNERSTKGKDDIFVSYWINEKYSEPVSLSDSINSAGYEFNAFVAPDESYIIFTAYQRQDGLGSGDLYISYKDSDSTWTKAKNLGQEINSAIMDYCPFVDIKTNTLYFTSKRTGINENGKGFTSVKEFLKEINRYDNGLSRIYKTSLRENTEN
jgi:hypothetical protein